MPMPTAECNPQTPRACEDCLRRSWLLVALSAGLDYRWRDPVRLTELLALEDEELVQAIGGRRKQELKARCAQLDRREFYPAEGVESVCRHDRRYPSALNGKGAPRMLNVAGGVQRLGELTATPVVAVVGSRRASDYGMQMAKSLARGLAASGVTVTSGLADGIAVAGHMGALEVDGQTVAVLPGGLDVACPAKWRSLYERVRRSGCAVAELPCGSQARRWGRLASERILAGLAELMVVVEAEEGPLELAGARMALELGRTVASVPGRVTSSLSRGTHALLMDGAPLVRGPQDVLELLRRLGEPVRGAQVRASVKRPASLEPRLKTTLERVGAGEDTPNKLSSPAQNAEEVLLALSELELMGLLTRGDGGRYVPRDSVAVRPSG